MDFRIVLSQINATVGDLDGNKQKILDSVRRAKNLDAKLVIFPELSITGYPPKDLLHRYDFLCKNREVVEEITKETSGIALILGFVDYYKSEKSEETEDISSPFFNRKLVLHNSACLIQNCKLLGKVYKVHLPNYDIFDEKRYFSPGRESPLLQIEDVKIGINICEDIWFENGPFQEQVRKGAQIMVNISASPFYSGKRAIRKNIIASRAKKYDVPVLFVNMVGGQDELVFDGSSYVFNSNGALVEKGKSFEEDFIVIDSFDRSNIEFSEKPMENVFDALVLGTRDYVKKNGFSKVVLGLSGGIDSALTAVIAREALGKENVIALLMPGPFSSEGSLIDAKKLSKNLGIEYREINIENIYKSYLNSLKGYFENKKMDVTEENIQARIRGNILMAFANKFNYIVLTTGNKSELAVGYSTLYGDMAGGLAVLSDVPKTMVYELSRYYNKRKEQEIIPDEIITKTPSAELRANQKDSDDLPPYDILDRILELYIEMGLSTEDIINKGLDKKYVLDVVRRINKNEFKRKQAPIGLKIKPKSFGSGRRMPITNKFLG